MFGLRLRVRILETGLEFVLGLVSKCTELSNVIASKCARACVCTENSCTLFRGVSFATTLMDQYMRMLCSEFVSQAVGGVINKIVDSKQSCDVRI